MTTTAVEGSSGRAEVRETLAEDGELTLEEPTKEEIRELRCQAIEEDHMRQSRYLHRFERALPERTRWKQKEIQRQMNRPASQREKTR